MFTSIQLYRVCMYVCMYVCVCVCEMELTWCGLSWLYDWSFSWIEVRSSSQAIFLSICECVSISNTSIFHSCSGFLWSPTETLNGLQMGALVTREWQSGLLRDTHKSSAHQHLIPGRLYIKWPKKFDMPLKQRNIYIYIYIYIIIIFIMSCW